MIIFSSADMEASRGAIHKGLSEKPQVSERSRYQKGPARRASESARLKAIETARNYPLRALAGAILVGFAFGAGLMLARGVSRSRS